MKGDKHGEIYTDELLNQMNRRMHKGNARLF